jgi:hypothetical protein
VSPRTKACNLPSIRGKPNKKATNKKRLISRESPSIVRVIKTYTQTTKKMQMLRMEMTHNITKQL